MSAATKLEPMLCPGFPDCSQTYRNGDPFTLHHHVTVVSVVDPVVVKLKRDDYIHNGAANACTTCQTILAEIQRFALEPNAKPSEAITAELEDLARELTEIAGWWVETSKADAERTIPKAIEYGSADFDTMAQAMLALVGDKFGGADDAEKMRVGREMAVLFYLNGKIGRALGAYAKGVMPSDDTLFDIRVYAMMWWRIRSTGTWVN